MPKLSSSLPKGDGNGLAAIERHLIDSPDQVQVALVLIDCKSTTTDNDTGEITATARIRRIEPIRPGDAAQANTLLRRAFEERTGKAVLPFDLEEDVRSAFGNVDPKTGEITES